VILLLLGRVPFIVGMAALLVTGAAAVALLEPTATGVAAIAAVNVIVHCGQMVGWICFTAMLDRLARRFSVEHRRRVAHRIDVAARRASDDARRRWTGVGIQRTIEVLESIADGALDPRDDSVRVRCARDEHHLRQLLMINPEFVHLSVWCARALTEARLRDVSLDLRIGSVMLEREQTEHEIGRLILDAVSRTPGHSSMTISLFQSHESVQLALVGDHGTIAIDQLRPHIPTPWQASMRAVDQRALMLVRLPSARHY